MSAETGEFIPIEAIPELKRKQEESKQDRDSIGIEGIVYQFKDGADVQKNYTAAK